MVLIGFNNKKEREEKERVIWSLWRKTYFSMGTVRLPLKPHLDHESQSNETPVDELAALYSGATLLCIVLSQHTEVMYSDYKALALFGGRKRGQH